jgi:hypothetical protein
MSESTEETVTVDLSLYPAIEDDMSLTPTLRDAKNPWGASIEHTPEIFDAADTLIRDSEETAKFIKEIEEDLEYNMEGLVTYSESHFCRCCDDVHQGPTIVANDKQRRQLLEMLTEFD